jgi:drug/metabolite transporter (DMT)-like permease
VPRRASSTREWAALSTIYIVWGSTYLAIRLMVRTIPALLGGGVRFLVAGGVMCAFIAARRGLGALRLSRRQLAATVLLGALMPAGGNGLVTVAEKHVPSGVAALIISSVPLWVVLLRFLDRQRMRPGVLAGVALGFVGVALVLLPGGRPSGVHASGVVVVLFAALCWASGSFISPRLPLPSDPLAIVAWEMVWGGVILLIAAAGAREPVHPATFTAQSIGGLVFLITIGSIVAYTAYTWLLRNVPISKVATYAYVNPVIAVFLGWAVLSEQLSRLALAGAAVIVASVAAIVRQEPASAPPMEEPIRVGAAGAWPACPQEPDSG